MGDELEVFRPGFPSLALLFFFSSALENFPEGGLRSPEVGYPPKSRYRLPQGGA